MREREKGASVCSESRGSRKYPERWREKTPFLLGSFFSAHLIIITGEEQIIVIVELS